MSRIGTLGSDTILLSRLMDIKTRLYDTQTQVSTGKKSQEYSGIARDSFRLVSIENQHGLAARFAETNTAQQTRLNVMGNSLQAVEKTIRTFRSELIAFKASDPTFNEGLSLIQRRAWEHLGEIQSYLNVKVDGQYLFSGSKTDTRPVDVAWGSLANFQASYKQPVVSASAGTVTFAAAGQTVTATNAGAFSGVAAGDTITVTGSVSNNTTYTVASVDATGTILTLTAAPVNEAVATGLTIQPQTTFPTTRAGNVALGANYYYEGDSFQKQHRVDENQTISLGITANDPAIEKAMRAMFMMSQGNMSQVASSNPTLVDNVITLINDSLEHNSTVSEMSSDMLGMFYELGSRQTTLKNAIASQKNFVGTAEARIADLENVEMTEAVARLTASQTSMQVSYTAFGRIRQLSLADFI